MHCPNCGTKAKEGADFCLKCGKMLEAPRTKKVINGLSIAGLIIAGIACLIIFANMGTPLDIKNEVTYSGGNNEFLLSAISNIFFYLVSPIIALILSIAGYKQNKNVIGMTGIIFSIIALFGVMMISFYIFSLY